MEENIVTTELVDEPTETMTTETEVEGNTIVVNVEVPVVPASVEETPETSTEETLEEIIEVEEIPEVVTYAMRSLDDTETTEDTTMSSVIVSVFGEYQGKTQTVTEVLADGSTIEYQEYVPGLAGLDWHWLSGVLLFSVVLWSFFRMVGGVLKRG